MKEAKAYLPFLRRVKNDYGNDPCYTSYLI